MRSFSSLIALTAFLTFSAMAGVSLAGDPADQKDKKETAGPKLSMSDDEKDEKKDKGGHVVFGDDKKDEKKEMGGK